MNRSHPISLMTMKLTTLFLTLFIIQSCAPKDFSFIKKEVWYYSPESEIAMKFDSSGRKLSGQILKTDHALADVATFKARKIGNRLSIRTENPGISKIRGKITEKKDGFAIKATKNQKSEFTALKPRPFPQPPFRYFDQISENTNRIETSYGKAPGYYSSLVIEDKLHIDYGQIVQEVAGNLKDNMFRDEIPLSMDIYLPENDAQPKRPLVMLIHGGAFVAGDKRDKLPSALAMHLASRGYVVVSVNYRMGYIFLPGMYSNLERCMYRATQDVRAALRYMIARADQFRIDPDQVFIGGSSAGGFLALLTAYMTQPEVWPAARGNLLKAQSDLGCLDCSTNQDKAFYQIKGVFNLWGAAPFPDLIDADERIPLLCIHGDRDEVIPIGYDYPFANVSPALSSFFSKKVYGSASVVDHTISMNIPSKLLVLQGAGHEPHLGPGNLMTSSYDDIQVGISDFLSDQLCPELPEIQGERNINKQMKTPVYSAKTGTYNRFYWQVKGGLILQENALTAKVVWFSNAPEKSLLVAGKGLNGQIKTLEVPVNVSGF